MGFKQVFAINPRGVKAGASLFGKLEFFKLEELSPDMGQNRSKSEVLHGLNTNITNSFVVSGPNMFTQVAISDPCCKKIKKGSKLGTTISTHLRSFLF